MITKDVLGIESPIWIVICAPLSNAKAPLRLASCHDGSQRAAKMLQHNWKGDSCCLFVLIRSRNRLRCQLSVFPLIGSSIEIDGELVTLPFTFYREDHRRALGAAFRWPVCFND